MDLLQTTPARYQAYIDELTWVQYYAMKLNYWLQSLEYTRFIVRWCMQFTN